jgi:hypothetical protein
MARDRTIPSSSTSTSSRRTKLEKLQHKKHRKDGSVFKKATLAKTNRVKSTDDDETSHKRRRRFTLHKLTREIRHAQRDVKPVFKQGPLKKLAKQVLYTCSGFQNVSFAISKESMDQFKTATETDLRTVLRAAHSVNTNDGKIHVLKPRDLCNGFRIFCDVRNDMQPINTLRTMANEFGSPLMKFELNKSFTVPGGEKFCQLTNEDKRYLIALKKKRDERLTKQAEAVKEKARLLQQKREERRRMKQEEKKRKQEEEKELETEQDSSEEEEQEEEDPKPTKKEKKESKKQKKQKDSEAEAENEMSD